MTGQRENGAAEDAPDAGGKDRDAGRITEELLRAKRLEEGSNRPIRASRPGADAEAARRAYLDLLKLSLCDLAGARTLSVMRSGDTRRAESPIFWRELPPDQLALRAMGADWPFSGLTMVGLKRLDDLQVCVESVVADGVAGDVIEIGAWRGGASILARATLDSLGAERRNVWIADSFKGLPEPDTESFPEDAELDLSQVGFLAVPAAEVRAHFARFDLDHEVEFVEGFFDETLPGLRGHGWSIVRLDGDSYEATWLGLDSLYPGLSAGGYMIVDDYGLIQECRQAVDDYRRVHGIHDPIERIDWTAVRWRRADESAPRTAGRPRPRRAGSQRAGTDAPPGRIPSERELELEREIQELRARLAVAEGEPRA